MKKSFVSMLLILILAANTIAEISEKKQGLVKGDSAPTFALPSLTGDYFVLREWSGPQLKKPWKNKTKHVVVVSFFASWCKPCITELPHLEKVAAKFTGKPVRFLLVNVGEKKDVVKSYVAKYKPEIPVLLDMYQKIAEKYDAQVLPRLFVLDRDGIIRLEQRGFSGKGDIEKELSELIDSLLKPTL